ncbi:MAG: hypothetical protein ACLQME_03355 [Alphaproteobacteria bacterium]
MRDDLLEAQAAVDWPVSHFPSLKQRFESWIDHNVEVRIKNPDPQSPYDVIVAVEKEALPLAFNVEVGAYINCIRTSLDILATALAHRYHIPNPNKTYFPIVASAKVFSGGKYKGHEFVEGLPAPERHLVESLQPYKGGNDPLWTLHDLDIKRKHQRLLTVESHPATIAVTGIGIERDFIPPGRGEWHRTNNETVLGRLRKGAPQPKIQLAAYVGFNEASVTTTSNVLDALNEFASLASSIIAMFDK